MPSSAPLSWQNRCTANLVRDRKSGGVKQRTRAPRSDINASTKKRAASGGKKTQKKQSK